MSVFSVQGSSRSTFQAALAACIVFAGAVSLMPSASVAADEVSSRLDRIQRDIDTLNQAVYKGKVPPAAAASASSSGASTEYQASVEVRLSDLEKQLRDITGQIEKQNYDISQMKERLDRSLSDMELRLSSSATTGAAATGSSAPTSITGDTTPVAGQAGTLAASDMGGPLDAKTAPTDPAAAAATSTSTSTTPAPSGPVLTGTDPTRNYDDPAPADSPTQKNLATITEAPGGAGIKPQAGNDPAGQYEMAFSLLKSGNYVASRNGFEAFMKKYPDHPLAPNALYWVGENYFAEGAYDKAVRVFAESYKKYPKGPKTPDSLLKLGMSLGKVGKSQQACITLKQLKKEYPAGNAVLMKSADQEIKNLACGG